MKLVSVYREPKAKQFLYGLMAQRLEEPGTNISHQSMPTMEEHEAFMDSKPYHVWYLVLDDNGEWVGAAYISKARELGIYILKEYRRRGLGKQAMEMVIAKWPGRFLLNIHPANAVSIKMFTSMGAQHIQNTYEIRA
ncbi:MAG: GNAT family N-acetyltransferase [Bellilinea sp.]